MMNVQLKTSLESYAQRATSLRFQIISIIFTTVALSTIMYKNYYTFKAFDPKPELHHYALSPENSAIQVVHTGIFIKNFSTFDITKNTFIMDALIWFSFDPNKVSLETIEEFAFEKGTMTHKSKPIIENKADTTVAQYDIRVQFTSNFDYRLFPFDDHRVFMTLINKKMRPHEIIFASQNSHLNLAEKIYTGGLKLLGKSVSTGFSRAQLVEGDTELSLESSRAVFALDFSKPGLRSILLILIPIIITFFMSLFSLSLDPHLHMRTIAMLALSGVASLFNYRFVIEVLSPSVGYFTLADYVYTYILICSFFIFLFSTFSIRTPELSHRIKALRVTAIFFLHLSLIMFVYALFNYII
jgi:hypothetical protein